MLKMPELGEGSHVWGFSEPAVSVGGDLYDVMPMPDGSWLVYVADVAGKGLPAALMIAAISAKIRSIAHLHNEVNKLLAQVNKGNYRFLARQCCDERRIDHSGNLARSSEVIPLFSI
jgi:hypothetical protein